jgi:hypothetical protein
MRGRPTVSLASGNWSVGSYATTLNPSQPTAHVDTFLQSRGGGDLARCPFKAAAWVRIPLGMPRSTTELRVRGRLMTWAIR